MFTGLVAATTAARGHAATTAGIDGVALWLPPGRDVGTWATIRSGFALPRAVLRLPSSERRDLLQMLTQFEKRRHQLVPEPHWYLQSIGVDPSSQGTGAGSALLRDGLDRADAQQAPSYLETETEANVGFYERRGFVVLEEHDLDVLGLPIWLMARRPPSSDAGGR
jgi:ribosomal protein S18 acetylase RimI-like enzyme